VLQTLCVAVGAEDGDAFVVGRAEGFEALVSLLAVVKSGSHAVDTHEGIGDEAKRSPFSCAFTVGRFNMAIDCRLSDTSSSTPEVALLTLADLEAHIGPVNGINRRRRKRSHTEQNSFRIKMKEICSSKVNSQFPQAPFIPPDTHIYKLFSKRCKLL
jgi:hypothetical protein